MKSKYIIGILILLLVLITAGLGLNNSGQFLQGALRTNYQLTTTRETNQIAPAKNTTQMDYLIPPEEEFNGCKSNAESGTIVLTNNSSEAEFSNFVAGLAQEMSNNSGYARCHYRMYVTKDGAIGNNNQNRIRVTCKDNIDAENNEIRCTRYDEDTPSDTNYFSIKITPGHATVTTHSTYYTESINRVEDFDTFWIEHTEK